MRAEPFRAVPARLQAGPASRTVGDARPACRPGLEPRGGRASAHRALPPDGLVLSTKLAELLGVRAGDDVTVEVLEGERPVRARSGVAARRRVHGHERLHVARRPAPADAGGPTACRAPTCRWTRRRSRRLYGRLKATPRWRASAFGGRRSRASGTTLGRIRVSSRARSRFCSRRSSRSASSTTASASRSPSAAPSWRRCA